jgi:hypothetical protein
VAPINDFRCPACGFEIELLRPSWQSEAPLCTCSEMGIVTPTSPEDRERLLASENPPKPMEKLLGRPSSFPGADSWRR